VFLFLFLTLSFGYVGGGWCFFFSFLLFLTFFSGVWVPYLSTKCFSNWFSLKFGLHASFTLLNFLHHLDTEGWDHGL